MRTTMAILAGLAMATSSGATDWPQWRGTERTALTPDPVAPSWPEGGPRKLWSITTPGAGYAAPSIVGDRVYLTGAEGAGDQHRGWLYALNTADGAPVWTREYGPEWRKNYDQARSSPTIVDGRLFLVSGLGKVVCYTIENGEKLWEVDTFGRFQGGNITWGIAESPLVYAGKVICHPGGPNAAVAALDTRTGATVWTSQGVADASAYCSPILATLGGVQQILTQTADHVVGLDAATGNVLWKAPHRNRYAVHPNTPLVLDGDRVVVSSGYGYGTELYRVSRDAAGTFTAEKVWFTKELDNHFHGLVLHEGGIFGASSGGGLCRLNPETGAITYTVGEAQRASLVRVPGRLIAYAERGESVFLLEAGPERYTVQGKFKVDFGEGPHWAHPAVANGVLYIRHGQSLAAYDIGTK